MLDTFKGQILDTFKALIGNQFEAALCTLNTCIDRCPESSWNARVGNYPLCQVAFHTLFYADFYLGQDEESFRRQPFHLENERFFGDYEQLEDREPVSLYDRASIKKYMGYCRHKASEDIQHHSAQLSLRLRISANQDIPWIGSGWREV